MVSELRCKKDIEDHILVGTMARVIKKGFKFLGNLDISIKGYILKVISNLAKEVMDGSLFFALSRTFRGENVWVIDSGASKHFIGYKKALSNLVERETNLNVILGDNSTQS